eukprot:TRINITY_DN315_c0_g1_i1.p1 TRINITY_DN315_c0_g1~~TRINITY_DN315_c0_g1_i1.p1  ORF type:complete len:1061 (+),score=410.72 TRINITY_DN315_c0_g1_i1:277-3183(+)
MMGKGALGPMGTAFGGDVYPAGYSMATGLHTGATGIYADEMYDSVLDATFSSGKVSPGKPGVGAKVPLADKSQWYAGKPVWETAAEYGLKATAGWPGSDTELALNAAGVTQVEALLAAGHRLVMMTDMSLASAASPVTQRAVLESWDLQMGRLMALVGADGDVVVVSHAGAEELTKTVALPTAGAAATATQTSGMFPRIYYADAGEVAAVYDALSAVDGVTAGKTAVADAGLHVAGAKLHRLGSVFASPVKAATFDAAVGLAAGSASVPGVFLGYGSSFRQGRVFTQAVQAVDVYPLVCKLSLLPAVEGVAGSLEALQKHALTRSPTRQHLIASKRFRLAQDEIAVMPPTASEFAVGVRFDLDVHVPLVLPGVEVDTFTWELRRGGVLMEGGLACMKAAGKDWTHRTTTSTHARFMVSACEIAEAGSYTLKVMSGKRSSTVAWSVRGLVGAGAKNVVLFIGDGMSVPMVTGARLLRHGARLPTDDFEVLGTSFVHALGSIVTDSAASASSINSGHKAVPGQTGVFPDGTDFVDMAAEPYTNNFDNARVELASEYFRRQYGAKIGVVSTASIVDATPAAVFAHYQDRNRETSLAAQALAEQPEVLLGGGLRAFTGERWAADGMPGEARDLRDEARQKGYAVVSTATQMAAAAKEGRKLLGLFEDKHMDTYVDRVGSELQPSLMQMTGAAIEALSHNASDRFYLQVEAASIDKQAHANDHVRMLADALELQNTIKKTMEQLAARGILEETLIVVTSDHATGGYDIYGTVNTDTGPENALASIEVYGAAEWPDYMIDDEGFHVKNWDSAQWAFAGMNNHHPEYREDFKLKHPQGWLYAHYADPSSVNLKGMLAEDSIGQSSSVHTAADVLVYAHGKGASYFQGGHDQTNIFFGIMNAMAPASQPVTSAPATTPAPSPPATTAPAPAVGTPAETVQCHCDKKEVSEGETALIVLVCLLFVLNLGFHIFNMRK